MVREIIRVKDEFYRVHIPKEYVNKKVEILVLPFDENDENDENSASRILKKTSGILKDKNIDPIKWQEEIRIDREI
ncbi:hypothetical protein [Hydrogenimonas thermophila]|uniref:Uncharacterized protein n=1 Tax=Hydrogenimonas thermophila TaxID=223786 RepID=A0A1I5V6C2_9BACT|nr:hypothetical protein [Hydrogenimonas thermophila]WOE69051.1 hypothetical protein RZR91_08020 [Hydrogenimonas thermophila]WOE71561.1 hypothetical protein RZR97_07995 [Hydrogenimonas thermophila]SFQ03059.1 hypothetical protein SAMN05216234_1912 [Hydrogenimonas thermophila]